MSRNQLQQYPEETKRPMSPVPLTFEPIGAITMRLLLRQAQPESEAA